MHTNTLTSSLQDPQFLTLSEVAKLLHVSKATVSRLASGFYVASAGRKKYRGVASQFPKPLRISERILRFRQADIVRYINTPR